MLSAKHCSRHSHAERERAPEYDSPPQNSKYVVPCLWNLRDGDTIDEGEDVGAAQYDDVGDAA